MSAAIATPSLTAVVRAAGRGDQRAWDALVHRFTPALRRVARAYHLNSMDVDDVVQACWVSLLESVHDLREPEALGGWLITTARRLALRARQREVREILVSEPVDEHRTAPDCLESEFLRAERASALHQAVRRLPEPQRRLVETWIAEPERSYRELSLGLGMPIGSIGPTRARGLHRLRADTLLAQLVTT
jgi:RNA polymerase sigma factor (sigma-70 family)